MSRSYIVQNTLVDLSHMCYNQCSLIQSTACLSDSTQKVNLSLVHAELLGTAPNIAEIFRLSGYNIGC
jgi:hypothetical protein